MLGSKFIKLPMSILKWQVNSSSNFASFFIVMTHNSSVNFNLILFLLWIKRSHQSPNFETFKCSGENLSYSSCHFPNYKSVFLKVLHHTSVSWKITLLYFFRSINTLHNRKQWKCKFFRLEVMRSKFTKFLSFLKKQISFSSNFASVFRFMRHNSSVYTFSAKILYTFNKRSLLKYKFG